jgi:hypothetical protein
MTALAASADALARAFDADFARPTAARAAAAEDLLAIRIGRAAAAAVTHRPSTSSTGSRFGSPVPNFLGAVVSGSR